MLSPRLTQTLILGSGLEPTQHWVLQESRGKRSNTLWGKAHIPNEQGRDEEICIKISKRHTFTVHHLLIVVESKFWIGDKICLKTEIKLLVGIV